MKIIINRARLAVLVTALGVGGLLPALVQAGPSPDLMNSALQSLKQAEKVPKGETVAMVCTKCQTVLLSKVDTKKGFLDWFNPRTKHECPGCGGEFALREVPAGQGGKLSVSEYVHTCSKCGENSAFCCTTKPSAGHTKAMEKK